MASSARVRADEDSTSTAVHADDPLAAGWRWLWQAPEVASVLGKHAESVAGHGVDSVSATALSIIAAGRLGRGLDVAGDALTALDRAEAGQHREIGWLLRLELASYAKSLRLPMAGMHALGPMLASATRPAIVGAALVRGHSLLAGRCGHRSELAEVLTVADRCYRADDYGDDDVAVLLRGALRVETARRHRRVGESGAAVSAAQEGLGLLSTLRRPELDSGKIRALLTLELVLALLDAGQSTRAVAVAEPVLRTPLRAPAATARCSLAHALAVRVHLPARRDDQAIALLADAADEAQRHGLAGVVATCQLALAEVHETAARPTDALDCLRAAQAAKRTDDRLRSKARAALIERFAVRDGQPDALVDRLVRWALSTTASPSAPLAEGDAVAAERHIDADAIDPVSSVTVPDARTADDDRAVSPTKPPGDSASDSAGDSAVAARPAEPDLAEAVAEAADVAVLPQTRSAPDDEPAGPQPAREPSTNERVVEKPAVRPKSTAPAKRSGPRHGTGSPDRIALSDVPGLVVAEGSGGRRRAPESTEPATPTDRPVKPTEKPATPTESAEQPESADKPADASMPADNDGEPRHAQPAATPTQPAATPIQPTSPSTQSPPTQSKSKPDPELGRPVPRLADLLAEALQELRSTEQHATHRASTTSDPLPRNGSSRRNGVESAPGRSSNADRPAERTDQDED